LILTMRNSVGDTDLQLNAGKSVKIAVK